MLYINVYNQSRVVTNAQVTQMCAACDVLLPEFLRAWRLPPATVRFVAGTPPKTLPLTTWTFVVLDDSDQQDALAYHTEADNSAVYGLVFAHTILTNGGVPLWRDTHTPTVASALAHEIFEALADPDAQLFALNQNTNTFWAYETADPVENNIVQVHVGTAVIGVSDFVYPAWFDIAAPAAARFNYLQTLHKPFTLAPGGYAVIIDPKSGEPQYIFGESMPAWQRELKQSAGRLVRRRARNTKNAPAAAAAVTKELTQVAKSDQEEKN